MKSMLLSLMCVVLITSGAFGVTVWNGSVDTDFGTADNWDNGLPGNVAGADGVVYGGEHVVDLTTAYTPANPFGLTLRNGSAAGDVQPDGYVDLLDVAAIALEWMLDGVSP